MEFTRKLVLKKVKQLFSNDSTGQIMEILDQYGIEQHEVSRERVQLAALRLCQGNEEKLRKHIEHARIDRRDIVRIAEEPNLTKLFVNLPNMKEDEIKRLEDKDREEYLSWLNS